jgi:hypothetical protein
MNGVWVFRAETSISILKSKINYMNEGVKKDKGERKDMKGFSPTDG